MIDTLSDLLARVVSEDERKLDLIADTRAMSVIVDRVGPEDKPRNDVILFADRPGGQESFKLCDHALGQVSTDLGIPKRYFDRMKATAPDLFTRNVNHWLISEPNKRLVRGYTPLPGQDGDNVGRAFLSNSFRRLDNIEIARKLLPEFKNLAHTVEFHQAAITDTKLYIRALFPSIERDIAEVGDTVRWGVEITNSEVGNGTLGIRGFVLRLSCKNGMTVAHTLKARHVGKREDEGILSNEALTADDTAFWLAARDVLKHTITETAFDEIVAQLQVAAGTEPLPRPVEATKVLANRHGLTDEERDLVLGSLVTGSDLSAWGLLNAVTATAKLADSFDRQAELEAIGWDIATQTGSEWNALVRA